MSQEEEIRYFIEAFDKASKELKEQIADAVWETAVDLSVLIEKDTPLGKPELWHSPPPPDYTPGTLKAGWLIEKTAGETMPTILIYNNVIYAERVEYSSWSTQAPDGMMRKNALNFQILLDAKLKEKGLV